MRHFLDTELKGHAIVFDGPLDLLREARRANSGPDPYHGKVNVNWPGRVATSWDGLHKFLSTPWPEATFMIREIVDAVKSTEMPKPVSIKRRMRWDDADGEVDVDRVMQGETEFYRRGKRQQVFGSSHVALLCNLDTDQHHSTNRTGVFFRSACAIAVADLLEDAGYSVEMWAWCRGDTVYAKPNHNQFICCRFKEAGDPIDYDACCDTLSHWFTTVAIYGAMAAVERPVTPIHQQGMHETIGPWLKYMDVAEGVRRVTVPTVTSSWMDADAVKSGITNAIKAAQKVLTEVAATDGL